MTEGCKTAGAHYNPFKKTHGGYDDERHVGDLGNLKADEKVIILHIGGCVYGCLK